MPPVPRRRREPSISPAMVRPSLDATVKTLPVDPNPTGAEPGPVARSRVRVAVRVRVRRSDASGGRRASGRTSRCVYGGSVTDDGDGDGGGDRDGHPSDRAHDRGLRLGRRRRRAGGPQDLRRARRPRDVRADGGDRPEHERGARGRRARSGLRAAPGRDGPGRLHGRRGEDGDARHRRHRVRGGRAGGRRCAAPPRRRPGAGVLERTPADGDLPGSPPTSNACFRSPSSPRPTCGRRRSSRACRSRSW